MKICPLILLEMRLTEEVINTHSVSSENKTEESLNKDEINLKRLKEKALEKLYYS